MDREELLREKLEEEWPEEDSEDSEEYEEKNDRFCWNPAWF